MGSSYSYVGKRSYENLIQAYMYMDWTNTEEKKAEHKNIIKWEAVNK